MNVSGSVNKLANLATVSVLSALIAVLLTGLILRRQSVIGIDYSYTSINKSYGYPTAYLFRQEQNFGEKQSVSQQVDFYNFTHSWLAWFTMMLAVNAVLMITTGWFYENSRH